MAQPNDPNNPIKPPASNRPKIRIEKRSPNPYLQEMYGRYRTPGIYGPPPKLTPDQQQRGYRLGPEGVYISRSVMRNPDFLRAAKKQATIYQMPDGQNQVEDVAMVPKGQGFWENPQRVARYHQMLQTMPPGTKPPEWVDAQAVDAAFKYLQTQNRDKPWYMWNALAEDDPVRSYLQQMPTPPPEVILPDEERQYYDPDWSKAQINEQELYSVPVEIAQQTFGADVLAGFRQQGNVYLVPGSALAGYLNPGTGTYQPGEMQDQAFGLPQDEWDQLPDWQKAIIPVLPYANTGMGVGSGALAGFGLGGPVGAAIGAAAGGGLAYAAEKNPALASVLNYLDIGAEYLERGEGVVSQVLASLLDSSRYGPVGEVLRNLPAAWEAAHMNYNVAGIGSLDYDPLTGKEVVYNWTLGKAEPEQWSAPSGAAASNWALAEARRRIIAGESPEKVTAEIQARFGFAGEMRDLVGHMFLDPLNLTGPVINKVGGKIAGAVGNEPMAKALEMQGDSTLQALRQYGITLRQMPPEEAAKFGALSRWIAGLDKAGNIKDFAKPPEKVNFINQWVGLDAKSRANELLTTMADGFQMALSEANTPSDVVRTVEAVAKLSPEDAVRAVENSSLPRWFASAEAQPAPLVARDTVETIKALRDDFVISRPQASLLQKMADFMEIRPERLVNDLHRAKPEEANTLLRGFVEKLKTSAEAGNKADEVYLRSILQDTGPNRLTGSTLKNMASAFVGKDAAPLRFDEFKARAAIALIEKTDSWAAKWFDVKPARWSIRLANTVKKAQGLALLGLNPTNLINNTIGNVVTMAWDGLLRLDPPGSLRKFLDEFGFDPARLRSGSPMDVNEAVLGEVSKDYSLGQNIRKAAQAEGGALKSIDEILAKGDKLAIFANMSEKIEQMSSERAMVAGMREFWDKMWVEGSGFDRMPDDLRMSLENIQAGLADRVHAAIRRGKNRKEIGEEIFQNLSRKSVRDVLSPQETQLLDHFPEAFSSLDEKVRNAKTADDIMVAFDETRSQIQTRITEEIQRNVERITQEALSVAQVEKTSGVLDIADDIANSRADFWLEHFRRMDEVASEAAKLTGARRRLVWQNALRESDWAWRNFENIEGSKWLGAFKGLGADDATYNKVMALLMDGHDNWRAFYDSRRQLMEAFYEKSEGLGDEASGALWRETNEKLNQDYIDATIEEDRIQMETDDLFSMQYARQFQGAEAQAAAWRDDVRKVRRAMAQAQILYRTGSLPGEVAQVMGNLLPDTTRNAIRILNQGGPVYALDRMTRDVVAKRFYNEIYAPFIKEMLEASNKHSLLSRQRPATPGDQPPAIPTNPAVRPLFDMAKQYGLVDKSGRPVERFALNVINKRQPNGEKFASLAEVPADVAEAAFRDHVFKNFGEEALKNIPVAAADPRATNEAMARRLETNLKKVQTGEDVTVWGRRPVRVAEGEVAPVLEQNGPAMGAPRGTVDGLRNPPIEQAVLEGYLRDLSPLMSKAENALTGPDAWNAEGVFDIKNLPGATMQRMRAYLGKVYQQLGDVKMGAVRWGESKRDFALLNYSKRYGFDSELTFMFPYQFWTSRSMMNWALRAIDRPALLANYARLKTFSQDAVEREGFPTRLKKKMGFNLPFMPDWMGEGVYADPLRQIFPFENFTRPWEALAEQRNLETRKTESIIQQRIQDGEISADEGQAALDQRKGYVWDNALAEARNQIDEEIENPADFAFKLVGPSLPVSIAYNYLTGRQEKISQLPVTRLIQNITAAAGIGGPRGINIEAPLRRAAGLPEIDRFEDGRVDKMLAYLVAEGLVSSDDALRAMIDKNGEAYTMAQQRVSQMGLWQYLGGPLGVDFFPEGEQEMRHLQVEYSRAIEAEAKGDEGAKDRFWEKHPEYEARQMSLKDPEERLRMYLISEVWEGYNQLGDLHKRQARKQLGDVFADGFVSKETRSYDSISNETLSTWAQIFKRNLPDRAPDAPQISLKLADEPTAAAVQAYNDERKRLFPDINPVLDQFYNLPEEERGAFKMEHPQIDQYNRWRTKHLAANPVIVPWVTSETSELYGLPVELQTYIYNYRSMKDETFPSIEATQSMYFGLQGQDRKAFLRQHPELPSYWDWREQTAAMFPESAPYILSDTKLRTAILGEDAKDLAPVIPQEIQSQITPPLAQALMMRALLGQNLSTGANKELARILKNAGITDANTYIESTILPAFAQ
jgi:hypothetical protein